MYGGLLVIAFLVIVIGCMLPFAIDYIKEHRKIK